MPQKCSVSFYPNLILHKTLMNIASNFLLPPQPQIQKNKGVFLFALPLILMLLSGCTESINFSTQAAQSKADNKKHVQDPRQQAIENGEDLREDKRYAQSDWQAYTYYDRRFNVDVLKKIPKRRAGNVDSHVWVYTSTFAKRFDMPSRWIGGEDFKGAIALAYKKRIVDLRTCGYFGDLESCREMNVNCTLDVYVPHQSKTIPWNTDKMYGRPYSPHNSRRFLLPFHYKDGKKRKQNFGLNVLENEINKAKITEQSYRDLRSYVGENGIDSVKTAFQFDKDGFGQQDGIVRVVEFHRNVLDGIDLITLQGLCRFANTGDGEAQIQFDENINNSEKNKKKIAYNVAILDRYGKNGGTHKNMRSDHIVYPGASFMKRVKAYQEANKSSDFFEYFKKNINKK